LWPSSVFRIRAFPSILHLDEQFSRPPLGANPNLASLTFGFEIPRLLRIDLVLFDVRFLLELWGATPGLV
jgi:hypothetical protein